MLFPKPKKNALFYFVIINMQSSFFITNSI